MSIGVISAQAFAPNKIPGLVLWLDAPDIGRIIESGGFVSEWSDKSSNGNDAIQTTGSRQPETNAFLINGNNVITFDGVNDVLNAASSSLLDNLFSGGGSVFSFVFPLTSGENNFGRIFEKETNTRNFIRDESGGSIRYAHIAGFSTTNGAFETSTRAITINASNLLGMTYDNSLTTNAPVFRINGVAVSTTTTNTPVGFALTDSGSDLLIGNRPDLARTWDGDFGEMVFYDRILTAGEIANLEKYMSNRWGVAIP